jgi:hypothetical protein
LADPCAKAEEQTNTVMAKDNTSRFIKIPPKGLENDVAMSLRRNCKGGEDSMWDPPGDLSRANCQLVEQRCSCGGGAIWGAR